MVGSVALSVLITRRIGGPLYRLEQTVKQLAEGDLALRLKFRSYDGEGMHALAASYNVAVGKVDGALCEVVASEKALRSSLEEALERAREAKQEALVAHLESARAQADKIQGALEAFELSQQPGE